MAQLFEIARKWRRALVIKISKYGNATGNRINTFLTSENVLEIRVLSNQMLAVLPQGTLVEAMRNN